MRRKFIAIAVAALVLAPAAARAAFPRPTGFVNDFAGVMLASTKSRLEGMLGSFERATGIEVAVVTLPSLNDEPIENVAVDLFKQWGIGKKAKDNGVLFLIAPKERKTRIEVGYGLEGAINDALAGRILDSAVIPRFKAGDIGAGIAAGAIAIVDVISRKENLGFDAEKAFGQGAQALMTPVRKKGGPLSVVLKIVVLIIMIIVFIRHPWLFIFFLGTMGRGGGGGGFGGGFGGFGGGLSGGGGASRGW